jgi:hypothetical protein
MKPTRRRSALVLALALASPWCAAQPMLAAPDAGNVTWGDWRFSYEVGDGNEEGLVLKNVRWKDTKVLHKASLPVVRVKYRGSGDSIGSGCGPWADQIDWGAIEKHDAAPTRVIKRIWGNHLEMAVYAEIGGYYLWQSYIFRVGDAAVFAKLYSAGWSCGQSGHKKDHKHHPYWRLDFDVDGVNNVVRQHSRQSASGPVSNAIFNTEGSSKRDATQASMWWTVRNPGTSRFVTVETPDNERSDPAGGPWFEFSRYDASVRKYKGEEDEGWTFGAKGNLGYANPAQSVQNGADIVLWPIGHLSHIWSAADEADPHWHERTVVMRPSW